MRQMQRRICSRLKKTAMHSFLCFGLALNVLAQGWCALPQLSKPRKPWLCCSAESMPYCGFAQMCLPLTTAKELCVRHAVLAGQMAPSDHLSEEAMRVVTNKM